MFLKVWRRHENDTMNSEETDTVATHEFGAIPMTSLKQFVGSK